MTLLKNILRFIIISSLLGLFTLVGLYFYVKSDIPSVSILKDVQLQTPMLVYTKDGKLINQFGQDWCWNTFDQNFEDTLLMGSQLDIPDILSLIFSCKSFLFSGATINFIVLNGIVFSCASLKN